MKSGMKEDVSNIYQLEGRVPIMKTIPFGLQHILAMFVAGIAALIQLYPVWKIGSGLPINLILPDDMEIKHPAA